jgi:hypothetical protein
MLPSSVMEKSPLLTLKPQEEKPASLQAFLLTA